MSAPASDGDEPEPQVIVIVDDGHRDAEILTAKDAAALIPVDVA